MDVAAAEFWLDEKKVYDLDFKTENNDGSQCLTGEALLDVYKDFVENYPMVSIEDPFDQDDFDAYQRMADDGGGGRRVVGADLPGTNPTRVKKAIDEKACNALLLKVDETA